MKRLLALLAVLAIAPIIAFARVDPGAVQFPGTLVVETIQLCSTSGSTVAINTPSPPMFGVQFKKGAITAGTYPQFQALDGTPWGVTFTNVRSWSDGSMKSAGILPGPFPKAVPVACVTANVLNNGTVPTASGLTTAALYGEDIKLNANGFSGALGTGLGLQGNWAALLANDANNVEVVDYGDGQGGRVFRILTHVESGGTAHGQMEVYWYVQQLLDASNALAGYRVLPRLTQPWYNHDTPAKNWRGLQDFNIQYGGGPTTITPPFPYLPADFPAANWVGAGSNAFNPASTPNWVQCGQQDAGACIISGYFTTTGTLPGGISANAIYCAQQVYSGGYIQFMPCAGGSFDPGINITTAGTGTHTFHPVPLLPHFGTLWGAQSNGRYTYIQGGGSVAADAPIIIKHDPTYLTASGVLPPFDMTLSPLPDPNPSTYFAGVTVQWDIANTGPLTLVIFPDTGEHQDLGLLDSYQVRHLYNQTAIDDRYVRNIGLAAGFFASDIRDFTTHGPINLADPSSSYTGMPASVATSFVWGYSGYAGFTLPTNGREALFFNSNSFSHYPHLAGYAYLHTGEPQYLDLEMEQANEAIFNRALADRNPTISATTYYGIVMGFSGWGYRDDAWSLRELTYASALWPDTDPAGTQLGQYLKDLRTRNTAFPPISLATQNAYTQSIGLWLAVGRQEYMIGYLDYVLSYAVAAAEDSGAMNVLQNINALYETHIFSTFNNWSLVTYLTWPFDYGALPYISGGGNFFAATLTWSAGIVTGTITGGTGNLSTGNVVRVSAGNAAYDGDFSVTSIDATHFTYPLVSDPGGSSGCGGCNVIPQEITDDAHLSFYADTLGEPIFTGSQVFFASGTPGTFAQLFFDYTPLISPGPGIQQNPSNGDKVIFQAYANVGVYPSEPPGGLAWNTPYYQVNTSAGPLSALSWLSGSITATAASPHGLTIGVAREMAITGAGPPTFDGAFLCTPTTSTQFTCPLASDPGGPVTFTGKYNTSNLAASPGGSPLAFSTSGQFNYLQFGLVPANPPSVFVTNYVFDSQGFLTNMVGSLNYMAKVGVTGLGTLLTDLNTRQVNILASNGGTRSTLYQSNPKYAIAVGSSPAPPSSVAGGGGGLFRRW